MKIELSAKQVHALATLIAKENSDVYYTTAQLKTFQLTKSCTEEESEIIDCAVDGEFYAVVDCMLGQVDPEDIVELFLSNSKK